MTSGRKWLGAAAIAAIALMLPVRAVAQADYRTTVTNTPGLLGYFPFTTQSGANSVVGGVAGTFGGNAALGAVGSGPVLISDPGNRPVSLDGSNGTFVNTSLVGGISTSGSMVGWFNLGVLPSTAGHFFTIAGQSQVGNDFDLQIETDNRIRFYTTGGGGVASATTLVTADIGTWHFVAATFTANGTRNLFLDGNPAVTDAAGGHAAGNGTFAIGESDVFTGRFFNGGLDEIAVFNRELTAQEVSDIYASRLTPVPEPSSLLLAGMTVSGWCILRRKKKRCQERTPSR